MFAAQARRAMFAPPSRVYLALGSVFADRSARLVMQNIVDMFTA